MKRHAAMAATAAAGTTAAATSTSTTVAGSTEKAAAPKPLLLEITADLDTAKANRFGSQHEFDAYSRGLVQPVITAKKAAMKESRPATIRLELLITGKAKSDKNLTSRVAASVKQAYIGAMNLNGIQSNFEFAHTT